MLSSFALAFICLFSTIEGNATYNKGNEYKYLNLRKRAIKLLSPLIIIAACIRLFLPTKNEMIMIYAGGKAMDFVQQDSSINKIPAQSTKIISDYLDKTIEDLKEDK